MVLVVVAVVVAVVLLVEVVAAVVVEVCSPSIDFILGETWQAGICDLFALLLSIMLELASCDGEPCSCPRAYQVFQYERLDSRAGTAVIPSRKKGTCR